MLILTAKEQRVLEQIWLDKFHVANNDRGNAQRWFESVIEFLEKRGDEIIPGFVRNEEFKVIEQGLSQEYMAKLAATVASDGARTEYDKAVLILTATPEDRAKALEALRA